METNLPHPGAGTYPSVRYCGERVQLLMQRFARAVQARARVPTLSCVRARVRPATCVQDSKAPRDGKFIEEIGTYYPVAETKRDVSLLRRPPLPLLFWHRCVPRGSAPAASPHRRLPLLVRAQQQEKLKVMRLEHERAKYWLSVGAQPTEPVARLLAAANLMPQPPRRDSSKVRGAPARVWTGCVQPAAALRHSQNRRSPLLSLAAFPAVATAAAAAAAVVVVD